MVNRRQQVIRRDTAGVAAHRLPVSRVAPAFIQRFERFFIRGRLGLERQRASGLAQQAAITGQFHVQPLGQVAQRGILARFSQVQAQRLIDRLGRQPFTIPFLHFDHSGRQRGNNFGVADALVEQRGDGHQKHQQQENHQRRDQCLSLPAVDPLGTSETLLQGRAGAFSQGHGDGHSELRNLSTRGRSPTQGAPGSDSTQTAYLAAQAVKRCSRDSPLSVQNATSICT
ncbi:hypothetical protein ALP75_202183 [Pseudomonas syringae pv. actinidiae]|nr:hypothetical protein ALP75_202183 [Pseudomonas syringae pv. actinidiae]